MENKNQGMQNQNSSVIAAESPRHAPERIYLDDRNPQVLLNRAHPEDVEYIRADVAQFEAVRAVNRIYSCYDHDNPSQCLDCDLRHKVLKAIRSGIYGQGNL